VQIEEMVTMVLNSISTQNLNILGVKDSTTIDVDVFAGRLKCWDKKWYVEGFHSSIVHPHNLIA